MVLASCYVKWNRTTEYYSGWKGQLSEDGGGALINQAIHGVDLLQWFAGMPVEVFAWTTQRVHRIESEDTCVAALRFGSGAFGTIEASTALWPGFSRRIEICGENGLGGDGRRRHRELGIPRRGGGATKSCARHARAVRWVSGAAAPMAIKFEGHLRQIQDFIDGIARQRPFFIEGREARKAVALVRAIYDSAANGKPVRL
jgi:predicted dehydrogenase